MATRMAAVGDLIAGALARARAGRALEQSRAQVEHMARVATVMDWRLPFRTSCGSRSPPFS
jgi:hypothetical protein